MPVLISFTLLAAEIARWFHLALELDTLSQILVYYPAIYINSGMFP